MMKQLANLLCVIICHFALPAPGLKILSILSAAGDGCPSKRSVSLESSAVNKTTNSSAASLMFADMTPQAVLSQGAVASRWCEVELELEVPENDPFVARLDGVVQYGMGFSVNSQGQGLQVTTSLEWSWDKSQKRTSQPASTILGPSPGSGGRDPEPVQFQVRPSIRPNTKSTCSRPAASKPILTIYQRYAVVLRMPASQDTNLGQWRAGVMSSYLNFDIVRDNCSP